MWKKTLPVNVYARNGAKEKFFRDLSTQLQEMTYDQMILVGDLNGVVNVDLDRSKTKKVTRK